MQRYVIRETPGESKQSIDSWVVVDVDWQMRLLSSLGVALCAKHKRPTE